MQAVGQHCHDDVGLDAIFGIVEDRPDSQIVLDLVEGLVDFGELDVGNSQCLGLLCREVGAQQVATLSSPHRCCPPRPAQPSSTRTCAGRTTTTERLRVFPSCPLITSKHARSSLQMLAIARAMAVLCAKIGRVVTRRSDALEKLSASDPGAAVRLGRRHRGRWKGGVHSAQQHITTGLGARHRADPRTPHCNPPKEDPPHIERTHPGPTTQPAPGRHGPRHRGASHQHRCGHLELRMSG